jgi:hypothetical protein
MAIWSGITDTTNALVLFFATITDYTMWRSIGWLLLGLALIGGGLALLAKSAIVPDVKVG